MVCDELRRVCCIYLWRSCCWTLPLQKHSQFISRKGVCFFLNPSNCALWSSATKYVICKFKIADELLFKGSRYYPDFDSDYWNYCLDIEEYYMKEYSKETAELLDYIVADLYASGEDVISARGKKFHLYNNYF